ncbi:hypothetical protein RUM43_003211 [Polyplax serrata]|uniref:Uncharacterized protein n=1 Tax=Polyplax serrata TaxID=468196 RepID=A0AAN8S6E8_POLSC
MYEKTLEKTWRYVNPGSGAPGRTPSQAQFDRGSYIKVPISGSSLLYPQQPQRNTNKMFKTLFAIFALLAVAFAAPAPAPAPKPVLLTYSAPAPVAYSAYSVPLAYSSYSHYSVPTAYAAYSSPYYYY